MKIISIDNCSINKTKIKFLSQTKLDKSIARSLVNNLNNKYKDTCVIYKAVANTYKILV